MAIVAYDDGGFPGFAGADTIVTGSIANGNTVIIFWQSRSPNTPPFTHASGLSGVTLLDSASTGFGDDGDAFLYSATKNGTGALTLTPSQTSNDYWRAIVWDCETMTVASGDMQSEGVFDDTISFVSAAMPSGGGTALGMVLGTRGADVTLSGPTWTGIDVEEPNEGYPSGRAGISYGEITLAASATATLTGMLSAANSHYEAWALLQGGGPPPPADVIPAPLWSYRSSIIRR